METRETASCSQSEAISAVPVMPHTKRSGIRTTKYTPMLVLLVGVRTILRRARRYEAGAIRAGLQRMESRARRTTMQHGMQGASKGRRGDNEVLPRADEGSEKKNT